MKQKIIPIVVAIVLIIFIGGGAAGWKLYDKYLAYSKEQANGDEYFHISAPGETAIIMNDTMLETRARYHEGRVYLDYDSVLELLNDRFYYDYNEGLLIYTTPSDIIKNPVGTSVSNISGEDTGFEYNISFTEGDTLYVALDYIQKYTNFEYEYYDEPSRIVLNNSWGHVSMATVSRNSAVRLKGGIKSEILSKVEKGDRLVIMEELEDWLKVCTADGYIGYIERKHLGSIGDEEEIDPQIYVEPEYTAIHKEGRFAMAWHPIYGVAGNDTFDAYTSDTGSLGVVAPTWFKLMDNEGNFQNNSSREYVEKAHKKGMEVWAVLDNVEYPVETYQVMGYTSKRERLIDSIMEQAVNLQLDGINLDFEALTQETVPHYIEFIREMSIACRKAGLVLSVDNYSPVGGMNYGLKEQGEVVDYVILMGYDEHWSGGGKAGSVASIGFVKQSIEMILEEGVPASKLVNAVPFYTRVWRTDGDVVKADTVGMDRAREFVEKNSVPVEWDSETCQNYGEKQLGAAFYQVWLEDSESIETKLNVMSTYNLPGVSAWALGLENKSIWTSIDKFVKGVQ